MSWFVKKGLECCSDTTITFHYMDIPDIVKLAKILDDAKMNNKTLTFKEIVEKMIK
jgi:hypothetical protein